MRAGGGVHMGGGMRGGPRGGVHVGGGHARRSCRRRRPGRRRPLVTGGGHAGGGQWSRRRPCRRRLGRRRPHAAFPARPRLPAPAAARRLRPPLLVRPAILHQNWQGYGFADPGEDRRWVRYYDDAYLVDRGGRVVDCPRGPRLGSIWRALGDRGRHPVLLRPQRISSRAKRIMPTSRSRAPSAMPTRAARRSRRR